MGNEVRILRMAEEFLQEDEDPAEEWSGSMRMQDMKLWTCQISCNYCSVINNFLKSHNSKHPQWFYEALLHSRKLRENLLRFTSQQFHAGVPHNNNSGLSLFNVESLRWSSLIRETCRLRFIHFRKAVTHYRVLTYSWCTSCLLRWHGGCILKINFCIDWSTITTQVWCDI